MSLQILEQLERSRRELLDLGTRNRLLHTPLDRSRSTRLDVVEELSSEVFRILVAEQKDMGFLPAKNVGLEAGRALSYMSSSDGMTGRSAHPTGDESDDDVMMSLPDEDASDEVTAARHSDRNLQTRLAEDKLQPRLLRLFYDAKSLQEEQGINSLFLAMGFLEWYEDPKSDKPRFAPLLLIPVELHRRSVNARFRLKLLDEDITTNLSLQARLKGDFGLALPDVPDVEELSPADYFTQVEEIISDQPRWKVHHHRMTVWFFSFAKFLMFRDLATEAWPVEGGPETHHLLRVLLGEPRAIEPPLFADDEPLDPHLEPQRLTHVVDCDSSQAVAIEEVRHGRSLVIQGPPGTGKSQTITNVIAAAVKDGKTVLFVAEKLAALEVVKSRLDRIGLGDMCLELHSHKAHRKSVLEELGRTLDLGKPRGAGFERQAAELTRTRDRLNGYVAQLHAPLEPFGVAPYHVIGRLCRLQGMGVRPFDAVVPELETWSRHTLAEKQALLSDVLGHLNELGDPVTHAWRGVRRETPLLPSELQTLHEQLSQIECGLRSILTEGEQLAGSLNVAWKAGTLGHLATEQVGQECPTYEAVESFETVQRLAMLAAKLQAIPEMDRNAFATSVWATECDSIKRVVEQGTELVKCRDWLDGKVAAVAWQMNVAQTRVDLAAYGRSWWRWLSGKWRTARRTLIGLLVGPLPTSLDEQLEILDTLIRAQTALRALSESGKLSKIGQVAFGALWNGEESDWSKLAAIVNWEADCRIQGVPKQFRPLIARWTQSAATREAYLALRDVFRQTWDLLRTVTRDLEWSVADVFQPQSLSSQRKGGKDNAPLRFEAVPLTRLLDLVSHWHAEVSRLGQWIVFRRRLKELTQAGLGAMVPQIEAGRVDDSAIERLELMFCETVMRRILAERDRIAGFDGVAQRRLVSDYRRLDEERLQLARREVALVHYDRLPAGGDSGEVGVVRGEARKKRRHKSIRQLIKEAGHAVQAIKPVFMMSPISVAQFLEPGTLSFDLLVIDEASQVRPVESLGAVLRSRQLVVVGDDRQLPPTQFFDRLTGGEDDDEQTTEGTAAHDVESILDLCQARNFSRQMLRWHYRSRHHSLIAVSNREFYDNGLFIVPSPERESHRRGLQFHFVENGVFDRGGSRTNREEARTVAAAMIAHAQTSSELSLGVGAFSVAQRDAILDELELLRREHPEAEPFFANGADEPWFVKNLENIQGDERDVILISVGYGKDKNGFFAMAFGPLTSQGGERRLNVLITRAKQRCVVFSSIHSDDIDLRRTQSRGTEALKTFLHYAETGQLAIAKVTDRDHDSEFEAQVADELRANGWQVDAQVGVAGFFIDLAVIDPACPGRYLIGIECDGATYHSARWARDRDRLRQSVLEDHGWTLSRIWSTDWFHSRDEQLHKLLAAIIDACHSDSAGLDTNSGERESVSPPTHESIVIEREESPDADDRDTETPFYTEANFTDPLMGTPLLDVPAADLAKIVRCVVEIEGPIHADELARRVTTLWGQARTGSRISAAVIKAAEYALRKQWLIEEDSFYWLATQTEFPARNRELVVSTGLKKLEMLPPRELQSAILPFVRDHISATPDEIIRHVARTLGFRSTSQQLKSVLESQIDVLITAGILRQDDVVPRGGRFLIHRLLWKNESD